MLYCKWLHRGAHVAKTYAGVWIRKITRLQAVAEVTIGRHRQRSDLDSHKQSSHGRWATVPAGRAGNVTEHLS